MVQTLAAAISWFSSFQFERINPPFPRAFL
jgi:hypothetical protein